MNYDLFYNKNLAHSIPSNHESWVINIVPIKTALKPVRCSKGTIHVHGDVVEVVWAICMSTHNNTLFWLRRNFWKYIVHNQIQLEDMRINNIWLVTRTGWYGKNIFSVIAFKNIAIFDNIVYQSPTSTTPHLHRDNISDMDHKHTPCSVCP